VTQCEDMEPADDERADLAEYVRIAIIFGLLVVDLLIVYEQIKDRPEFLIWRAKVTNAVTGPFKRHREQRRAESRVVWEAIQAVEQKETP
jgi:hypothetical protein